MGLSGEGFVLGAVVGTLQCFGEGFIAAPVGKGTEAAGDGGGIGGGVETEDFGLGEEARGKIGGGFGEEDATEAEKEGGIGGGGVGEEAEDGSEVFAGAGPVFAVAVKGEVAAGLWEEGEAVLAEGLGEGNGECVGGELCGEDRLGAEEGPDGILGEGRHLNADVVGGGFGTLDFSFDEAGGDGEGFDLALLSVVAATAEASAHVEAFEPGEEVAAPPSVASATLGAESAADGFGEAWGVGFGAAHRLVVADGAGTEEVEGEGVAFGIGVALVDSTLR